MSSTSRPPNSHLRSRVNDLRSMTWRWLSFTHVWIAIGAFTTTLLSGVWSVQRPPWDAESMAIATWVALSTGLGYGVQRAIKHAKHPKTCLPCASSFGTSMEGACWWAGAFCGSRSTSASSRSFNGIDLSVKRTVALLGLASLGLFLGSWICRRAEKGDVVEGAPHRRRLGHGHNPSSRGVLRPPALGPKVCVHCQLDLAV